jgi:iron complex outermembrane receptor protein
MNGYGQSGVAGGFGNYGLDFTNYIQFSNATNRGVGSFADPSSELQSYFGRADLNYNDRYLLGVTLRADGSTKFGASNKYGYFPSISGRWNVSKESFFKSGFINNLSLRAGWGKTGNQEFPAGAAVYRYGFSGDNSGGTPALNVGNDSLKWQSDVQYNLGVELTLLNNRVSVTMDCYSL